MAKAEQGKNDGLRIGGLMRCCTETVYDLYPEGPARIAAEGQTLRCKYYPDSLNHRMIFRDGAWELGSRGLGFTSGHTVSSVRISGIAPDAPRRKDGTFSEQQASQQAPRTRQEQLPCAAVPARP